MECCARCIAYGFEVAMDEDKIRKGFYEGSQFVDFAHRDGIVHGMDLVYMMLKSNYPKAFASTKQKTLYDSVMHKLLMKIQRTVDEANEWLQEEDPTNRKIESVWLREHNNG
jgi:hypothetical protein